MAGMKKPNDHAELTQVLPLFELKDNVTKSTVLYSHPTRLFVVNGLISIRTIYSYMPVTVVKETGQTLEH